MKRSTPSTATAATTTTTNKHQKLDTTKNFLLFVGSAGGKIAGEDEDGNVTNEKKSHRHFLEKQGFHFINSPVRSLEGKKFTGGSGPTPKRVVGLNKAINDAYTDCIADASSAQDVHLFLASSSFGCRAIAHALSGVYLQCKSEKKGVLVPERFPLLSGPLWGTDHRSLEINYPTHSLPQQDTHQQIAGVIMFGYPIAAKTGSRIPDLCLIPKGTKIMFVTGTKDKFKECNFAAQMRRVVPTLLCADTCRLHIVEGGHHNPITGASEAELNRLQEGIANFMDYCLSGRVPCMDNSSSGGGGGGGGGGEGETKRDT
jgi:hypothetical protein